jgi:hypothetical protein
LDNLKHPLKKRGINPSFLLVKIEQNPATNTGKERSMPQNKRKKLFLSRVPVAINQHAPVYIDRKKQAKKYACRKKGSR